MKIKRMQEIHKAIVGKNINTIISVKKLFDILDL